MYWFLYELLWLKMYKVEDCADHSTLKMQNSKVWFVSWKASQNLLGICMYGHVQWASKKKQPKSLGMAPEGFL